MKFKIELEQEEDGRWMAEVTELPGVPAYGPTESEAQARVQAVAVDPDGDFVVVWQSRGSDGGAGKHVPNAAGAGSQPASGEVSPTWSGSPFKSAPQRAEPRRRPVADGGERVR